MTKIIIIAIALLYLLIALQVFTGQPKADPFCSELNRLSQGDNEWNKERFYNFKEEFPEFVELCGL